VTRTLTPPTDCVPRIERYNAGRETERLALKYRAMGRSPFAFFRGTAHIFWEDARAAASLPDGPPAWACGDLHLENFGSYRGANGLAYFDLNDFDEAALAPAPWELARFVTSLYVAAPSLGLGRSDATALARYFLEAYQRALSNGKALWIERATAKGMVRDLLLAVKGRSRAELIESRTRWRSGRVLLRTDGRHALAIPVGSRAATVSLFGRFARAGLHGERYRLLDVARRIAGTGSLGIHRYVLLVSEEDRPERRILLDVKEARPSALAPFASVPQPTWASEAERVVQLQHRMQAVSPALLQAANIGGVAYVVRELQPTEDRLSLATASDRPRRLRGALKSMARVVAWAQLRSSGRGGAATADELIAFAATRGWQQGLIDYARRYQRTANADWRRFVTRLDSSAGSTSS
jgi:uncharacterized protein (DUF2252 family)